MGLYNAIFAATGKRIGHCRIGKQLETKDKFERSSFLEGEQDEQKK
jgi:hypothetical protein